MGGTHFLPAMTSNCFNTHCNTLSSKLNPDAPPFIPNPNPIHNKNDTASIGSTRGKSRRHGQHHNGQTNVTDIRLKTSDSNDRGSRNNVNIGHLNINTLNPNHNDSLWHPLHTKEGDEISMFWGPCLQSSISTLSFSFLALFFCYAVSSCVYDHNHPYLVSERLFLAENKAFPYLRRALAHPRRALAIL